MDLFKVRTVKYCERQNDSVYLESIYLSILMNSLSANVYHFISSLCLLSKLTSIDCIFPNRLSH